MLIALQNAKLLLLAEHSCWCKRKREVKKTKKNKKKPDNMWSSFNNNANVND